MNNQKERNEREAWIIYGFSLEVFFFVSTGFLIAISSWWSIVFLFIGIMIAYVVGLQIRENVLENAKWGLD